MSEYRTNCTVLPADMLSRIFKACSLARSNRLPDRVLNELSTKTTSDLSLEDVRGAATSDTKKGLANAKANRIKATIRIKSRRRWRSV